LIITVGTSNNVEWPFHRPTKVRPSRLARRSIRHVLVTSWHGDGHIENLRRDLDNRVVRRSATNEENPLWFDPHGAEGAQSVSEAAEQPFYRSAREI
jgi:hypothetical protein